MPNHPQISSLPKFINSYGWTWKSLEDKGHDFWLGTDLQGNRWLTKLRGSFYAYREIVFARMFQELGWSIQSSCFLKLDKTSALEIGGEENEVHSIHWFMEEHQFGGCSINCPLVSLNGNLTIDDFMKSGVINIRDLLKSEIAIYIFGANEPCGYFFTPEHALVIIDSEQVFSTQPVQIEDSPWFADKDGLKLALEVCSEIAAITNSQINRFLDIPQEISVEETWPIKNRLCEGIAYAREFLKSYSEY